MNKIEIIARFLEDFTMELGRDHEIAPSLKRIPKSEDTWKGFIYDAKKLERHLTPAAPDDEELCHCRENFSLTRLRCNICMKPIYPRRR